MMSNNIRISLYDYREMSTETPQYKILIENRDYTIWSIHNPLTFEELYKYSAVSDPAPPHNINPITQKYFNKDIFEAEKCHIIHSPIREAEQLAGILVLAGNRTYGYSVNKKRLLYKCIPDDKRLPCFLVPYEIKASYSKHYLNKYVLFRYSNWNDKHPHGVLVQTLGDVDKLDAFYEYQLYRKSLQVSMAQFMESAKKAVSGGEAGDIEASVKHNSHFMLEDRVSTHRVITIDNPNTVDYDDGISITRGGGAAADEYIVSIYISNVFFIIETLNLWNSLTKRVSTIYLPDRRRPMIPSILSDSLCSLRSGEKRFTFACDFTIRAGEICGVEFRNAHVSIAKNYTYSSVSTDPDFCLLQKITAQISGSVGEIGANDVVAFWMIQMNSVCAERMLNYKNGIYKSGGCALPPQYSLKTATMDDIEQETRHVIRSWNNTSGQYMLFSPDQPIHDYVGKTYIHITSPIRRLVDLLNQTIFLENLGLVTKISDNARAFLTRWMGEIDYINTSVRSIKKIQTDCFLLQRCVENPDVLEKTYDGVVFDKLVKGDGGLITYMVYLQELRLLSRVSVVGGGENIPENFDKKKFRIFLFEDSDNLRRKIRLHIID